VGTEAPCGTDAVVDGAPHERVPEPKGTPVARRVHETRGRELVHGREGVAHLLVRRGARQLGVEGVAADRRSLEQRPRAGPERVDLEPNRCHQGRGQAAGRLTGGARQLAQEERIARRLGGHPLAQLGIGEFPQQRQRRFALQRPKRDLRYPSRVAGRVEQPRRRLDRPQRKCQQVRSAGRPSEEVKDKLDRGIVGPVQVVQHQHHGPLAGEELQEAAERAVVPEALGGADVAPGVRGAAGRRGRQYRPEVGPQ